jgi:hypothetical protein
MSRSGARRRFKSGPDSSWFSSRAANWQNLLSVQTPSIRFSDMALPEALAERLKRVLLEQRQQKRLREFDALGAHRSQSNDVGEIRRAS